MFECPELSGRSKARLHFVDQEGRTVLERSTHDWHTDRGLTYLFGDFLKALEKRWASMKITAFTLNRFHCHADYGISF